MILMPNYIVLGIDLAGSEKRNTGICILDSQLNAVTLILHTDSEILSLAEKVKPDLVAVDAPLTLPYGRKTLDRKENVHFRQCDKKLLELGIKFFPITLGPMRTLTRRGIALKQKLEKLGFKVIEVYPGGAQDLLGIPRKSKGLKKLRDGLIRLGIKGLKEKMSGDELDAVTAAYVGLLFLEGKALLLNGKDGCIVMPKPRTFQNTTTNKHSS